MAWYRVQGGGVFVGELTMLREPKPVIIVFTGLAVMTMSDVEINQYIRSHGISIGIDGHWGRKIRSAWVAHVSKFLRVGLEEHYAAQSFKFQLSAVPDLTCFDPVED
jgi:hypothetical protein